MLKKRNDVFAAFIKYLRRVERKHGEKIIKIRSDNAKEYVTKEFNFSSVPRDRRNKERVLYS